MKSLPGFRPAASADMARLDRQAYSPTTPKRMTAKRRHAIKEPARVDINLHKASLAMSQVAAEFRTPTRESELLKWQASATSCTQPNATLFSDLPNQNSSTATSAKLGVYIVEMRTILLSFCHALENLESLRILIHSLQSHRPSSFGRSLVENFKAAPFQDCCRI